MTVRRGEPDSVKAVGLKVYLMGAECCAGSGDGERATASGGPDGLGGMAGAVTLGACFDGRAGGEPVWLRAGYGLNAGIVQSIAFSFAGTAG